MNNNKINKIIEQLSGQLAEIEELNNNFVPITKLETIKTEINDSLDYLKSASENSTDISDKIFYINKTTDLIKKIENIFDMKSKRIQQALQTLIKIDAQQKQDKLFNASNNLNDNKNNEEEEENNVNFSPEQCNAIINILNQNINDNNE